MRYLGLDQALQTSGWAVFEDDKLIAQDSFTTSSKNTIGNRLWQLFEHLTSLYEEYNFQMVFFEDIQNQQSIATYCKLAYVQAIVLLWCTCNNVEYNLLAPSHWRKIIGGNFGNRREAQKAYAIQKVKELYGITVGSDAADAILIGKAGYDEFINAN